MNKKQTNMLSGNEWLDAIREQTITWDNIFQVHITIYLPLGLNELTHSGLVMVMR